MTMLHKVNRLAPYSDVAGPVFMGSSYVSSALQAMVPRPGDTADMPIPKATLMLVGGSFCAMAGVASLHSILNAPCGSQRPIPPQFGSVEAWLLICGGASLAGTGAYDGFKNFEAPMLGCLLIATGALKLALHCEDQASWTETQTDRTGAEANTLKKFRELFPYSDVAGPISIGSPYVTSAFQAMVPQPGDTADMPMPKATLMLVGGSLCAMAGLVSLRSVLNAPCGTQRPIPPQYGLLQSWLLICGGLSLVGAGSFDKFESYEAPMMGCLLVVTGKLKLALHYLDQAKKIETQANRMESQGKISKVD